MPEEFKIPVSDSDPVSGLLYRAQDTVRKNVSVILGHGAGAPQKSPFMVLIASGLAARGIDAVTFNFRYMEYGRRLPDPGPKLESCYRSVIDAVRAQTGLERNRLVIGGKSMGGRIASQVAAKMAGSGDQVTGLVFLGYPLHPPGKLEQLRDKHLPQIEAPMLFVQGSRDAFGSPDELKRSLAQVHTPYRIYGIEGGDHSFKVPKKGPVPQDQAYANVMDEIAAWISQL